MRRLVVCPVFAGSCVFVVLLGLGFCVSDDEELLGLAGVGSEFDSAFSGIINTLIINSGNRCARALLVFACFCPVFRVKNPENGPKMRKSQVSTSAAALMLPC